MVDDAATTPGPAITMLITGSGRDSVFGIRAVGLLRDSLKECV